MAALVVASSLLSPSASGADWVASGWFSPDILASMSSTCTRDPARPRAPPATCASADDAQQESQLAGDAPLPSNIVWQSNVTCICLRQVYSCWVAGGVGGNLN